MLKLATKFAPQQSAFEVAWRAGFQFAEFWLSSDLLNDVSKIVELGQQYPLCYVPHLPNSSVTAQTVSQIVRLYHELDCQALVLHQPMIDQWGEEFNKTAPQLRLAVENHKLSEKRFWEWAERNPGLNLDVEHLWKFTLKDAPLPTVKKTLDSFLSRFHQKLRHVHLPGYLPGQSEHRPMYCSRDFMFVVWDALSKYDYQGFVVSEVDAAYQTEADLRMDQLLFQRWHDIRLEASAAKSQGCSNF